ncbi:Hypothetical protein PBC10988_2800 [Planctomycetales bacterium 10988]|nr:Hypothetical protein PBC10988_2800 [Planctomycetales bacterium 10988]
MDRLKSLKSMPNPFESTVVKDAWQQDTIDVPVIHQAQFQSCQRLIESVSQNGTTESLLIFGETGSGKTHLLRRLRAQLLDSENFNEGPTSSRALFIYMKLQTSPRMIWRALRRQFATDLLRSTSRKISQLETLLATRFAQELGISSDPIDWWLDFRQQHSSMDSLRDHISDLFEELNTNISYNLRVALTLLLMGHHRADAKAWLRGDMLPDAILEAMGLSSHQHEEVELEDEAKMCVLHLCSLAGRSTCFVICFDQIEALQQNINDRAGLSAFGNMVVTLYHNTTNLSLISCIQTTLQHELKEALHESDYQKLSAFGKNIFLQTLKWEDAFELVKARLQASHDLWELHKSDPSLGGLWPLSEAEVQKLCPIPARKLIWNCRELFEKARNKQVPIIPVEEFLRNSLNESLESCLADSNPAQTTEVLEHGLLQLEDFTTENWEVSKLEDLRDVDLLLSGKDGNIGVSFCNEASMNSLCRRLKRLRDQAKDKRFQKLAILRDPRIPITPTAKAANQYRKELLEKTSTNFLTPSLEAIAALDAIRKLLSDSKAGDLSLQGESIEPDKVKSWLLDNLPFELDDFLKDVLSAPMIYPPHYELVEKIAELVEDQYLLDLTTVANHLKESITTLQNCIDKHPQRFGLLDGKAKVVYQLVPENFKTIN